MRIPTNLITGYLGAGKTTAILDLLRQRPQGERWAVLVNEFGEVGIDGAALEGAADAGVAIWEIPGGCLCCSAQVALRVTLARLLREARPARLLIEPTGLGHPAGIVDTLRDEYLAKAIELRATVCLVDPRQFIDFQIAHHPVFQDQINLADVLVANKTDLATAQELHRFLLDANALYPPKLLVEQTRWGKLDPEWLDIDLREGRNAAYPDAHSHPPDAHPRNASPAGRGQRFMHRGPGGSSCGWVFPAETVFDGARLKHLLAGINRPGGPQIAKLLRAKGVLRTGRGWQLVNWSPGAPEFRPIAYQRDSRFEILGEGDFTTHELDAFEAALGNVLVLS